MVGLGDPNSPARVFLNQCALLNPTSVPWALFQENERAISKTQLVSGWEELGNIIWRLEKHGLARLDVPEKRFTIEAPLQTFLLSTNGQIEINRDTLMMASLLARSDLSTHSDMLLPHFNALKWRFGDVMQRHESSHKPFFDWLFYFGSFFKLQRTASADSDAIIFYELALKHWRMLQLSGRSLVDLLNNLGLVYHRAGDSSRASKCFVEAFELLARDEPSDLEALIKLKCNAVSVLKISDPLQDGLRELENLEKSAEEQGNISSSVMVNLYFVMGTTELRCGEVKVARRFLEKANELWNSTHDSADDTAFEIAHNIGQAYAEQGSYFKAIEWHKDTLENRIAHFGEDHYDTQKSRASLGNAYALKKEWGKAQKEFETAIAWQVKNLGGHNIDTLKTRQDYGCRLGEQGKFDEAKSVLESVYEDRRKYYRNTWDCANVAADLAILFRDAHMESEARHYFREADEWYDRNPSNEPQQHDYRYKNKYLYAELIRFTNKQKARKLLEEARDNLAGRKRSTVWYKLACERLDELTKADNNANKRLSGNDGRSDRIGEGNSHEQEGGFDIRLSSGTEKGAIFNQPRTFNELNKTWDRCFQFHVRDTRVKIAVLDTGIDLEHEDFRAARATSFIGGRPKSAPGEDPQTDRIKEKRNFCGDEDCVQDYDGHGTQVAGIILRLAPRADIYVARICDGNVVQNGGDNHGKSYITNPTPKAVKEAILWAIEKKVDIINMSFGFNAEVPEINEALNSARENRTLVFAAMRNDGIFEKAAWPARELQDSIGIHSCIEEGKRSSVFTPKCVAANPNLMTVGENIPTHQLTARGGGFRVSTGTSFATPVAVAMAALILAFVNQIRCKAERTNLGTEKLEMMRENYWMARILKHVSDESDDNYSWINPGLLWIKESGEDMRDKLSHEELKRHAWGVLDAALKK
ncbi:hypothetical protein F4821DRAFT_211082 [Hypoxylon rubiginosum]|uniref:Uncharacterized protein n=1 Tax=Hypoxylon rubiginosum TaxID=110542 RepID=A0ACC0DFF6_9PEZI|nr:hypothetical protein F4821DRAFT_211082 [Hypoxylon rubiginosum]